MSDGDASWNTSPEDKAKKESDDQESRARAQGRETRERTPTSSEKSLGPKERDSVAENRKLSSLAIYSVIWREGEEELHRPKISLWWSGVAAGIGISTSVLAEGIIRANMGSDHPYLTLFESLGYAFGFVLVILCRLQLFTENTITVVLPVLADPTRNQFYSAARLWAIVLSANVCGTFLTAAIAVYGSILTDDTLFAILEISRHLTTLTPMETFLRGIPSGFFIAALVWMLPSAKGSSVLVIIMFTWLIAAGGFTHVIAGSNEIFTLVLNGEMNIFTAFTHHIVPVLIGNILGGTGLFAMLAYGQVQEEM
ncbi:MULTISPECIES: formate/nitrite transporter family protein [unclassified Marinobacter]|jgi:formate/nitrite transporter FocA (FNT family)|uniref:formate/nitrite transporter family protein n=1 Tax=unclassified Marinobacter TaxID=83889 RepID=UPI00200F7DFB|nr:MULTISPECIES: formate/nitrite transporter family protein [unclassified Marinobacter]MCL1479240.1 formate/nitrite transporter family protein [Marinobacter sp.]UQG54232.1 formate/nitrite transporter family protein [Marinobacter sp. M4C]UQG63039.1 formate/nitrite transporter family protein [Marinobacter sp. M2C]UQG67317.1 formate/nitrite transporter family protein [Marinobacter sp. M1C]